MNLEYVREYVSIGEKLMKKIDVSFKVRIYCFGLFFWFWFINKNFFLGKRGKNWELLRISIRGKFVERKFVICVSYEEIIKSLLFLDDFFFFIVIRGGVVNCFFWFLI